MCYCYYLYLFVTRVSLSPGGVRDGPNAVRLPSGHPDPEREPARSDGWNRVHVRPGVEQARQLRGAFLCWRSPEPKS